MTNNYPLYPRTWINGDRTEQQLVELRLTSSALPRMGIWQKSTDRLSHYTRVSPQSTALPKTSLSLATFDAKSHQITIKNCKKESNSSSTTPVVYPSLFFWCHDLSTFSNTKNSILSFPSTHIYSGKVFQLKNISMSHFQGFQPVSNNCLHVGVKNATQGIL